MMPRTAGETASPELGSALHRNLARGILELLRTRGLGRGARLSRPDLAAALGVSRTPIEGALALLAELGVVDTTNRSVRVLDAGRDPSVLALPPSADSIAALLGAMARDRRNGALPDEVSERLLSQRYGAGRITVAHALRQFAEAGVMTRNRGHGWRFVPGLTSAEDRAASYRFRILIEPAALLEPGFTLPAGFAGQMRAAHLAFLDRAWTEADPVAFFNTNAAFHAGLAHASGNRFLAGAVDQQNRLRLLSNYDWRLGPARVAVSVREHLAVLDALVAGDVAEAAARMRQHLAGTAAAGAAVEPAQSAALPDAHLRDD